MTAFETMMPALAKSRNMFLRIGDDAWAHYHRGDLVVYTTMKSGPSMLSFPLPHLKSMPFELQVIFSALASADWTEITQSEYMEAIDTLTF